MATTTTSSKKSSYVTGTLPSGEKVTFTSADAAKGYGAKLDSPSPTPDTFRYTKDTTGDTPLARPKYQEVDENAIREATRKRMQSTIDAIDAQYAGLVQQEQITGQDRLGQTRAINARSGLMGSDFGQANTIKTQQFNTDQIKSIESEKANKVAAIMAGIEDRASQAIAAARDQADKKYQREFGEFTKIQESARADLKSLAESNFDLNTMDPSRKAALFKQAGYDDSVMGDLLFNAMKPKAGQIDYNYFEQADGSIMAVGVDPLTGQLKKEILQGVGPDVGFVLDMISKYPDAGILPTDDLTTASAKIKNSRIYRKDTYIAPRAGTGTGTGTGDPTVDSWVALIQAGQATISTVPAALKNAVAAALSTGGLMNSDKAIQTSQQLAFLKQTAEDALALADASGTSGFAKKLGDTFVGDTKFRRLETLTNTLRTNVLTLATDPDVKKFFGPQMSEADVRLMTAAGTTLNPEGQSPEMMKAELGRLINLFDRMSAAATSGAASAPTAGGEIRVRMKSTGQTGSIPESEFDPAIYERI